MNMQTPIKASSTTFDVFRKCGSDRADEYLGSFHTHGEAFAFARSYAAANRCDMTVSVPEPEVPDEYQF